MKKLIPILQILFLAILMISCTAKKETHIEKPEHFLDEETFFNVVLDARITEGIIRNTVSYGKAPEEVSKFYYDKLFHKYGISAKDYQENLAYYSKDPEKIHEIYAKVVTRLTEIQSEWASRK